MTFTNEDALVYYTQINDLVTKHLKKVNDKDELDYNQFWSAVLSITADKVRAKTEELDVDLKKDGVGYMNNPTEYRGWNVSLMVMSWLLHNLKKKTENGHCRIHNLPCKSGSEFHNNLYLECLKSFKNLVESFEKNPPKPIV